MGKAGKDRKRRRLLAEVSATGVGAHHLKEDQENIDSSASASENLSHSKSFGGIVSEEDMAITLKTLLALEQHTEVFRSKACKALRAVVHQLQQTATATTGVGKSPLKCLRFHFLLVISFCHILQTGYPTRTTIPVLIFFGICSHRTNPDWTYLGCFGRWSLERCHDGIGGDAS